LGAQREVAQLDNLKAFSSERPDLLDTDHPKQAPRFVRLKNSMIADGPWLYSRGRAVALQSEPGKT